MLQRAPSRSRNILRLLKTAITGSETEYTTGSINRAIFMLSVPMVLEMLMESLFAVVDVFFVSKLGIDAVATVGLTESVITLIYSIAIGISMAATAMVARRIGEKKPDEAAHTAMQAIYFGTGISLLVSIAGLIFAIDVLLLMGADTRLSDNNYHY